MSFSMVSVKRLVFESVLGVALHLKSRFYFDMIVYDYIFLTFLTERALVINSRIAKVMLLVVRWVSM